MSTTTGNGGTGEVPSRPGAPQDLAVDLGDDDIWFHSDDQVPVAPSGPTARKKSTARNVAEWAVVVGGAMLVAVVVRVFLFQTFWIPSESMATTLVIKDRVIVNKLSYRLHDVNRGDVVVFHRPPDQAPSEIKDLIKRVIALEGERISIRDDTVYIDGSALEEGYTRGLPTQQMFCAEREMEGLYTEAGFEVPEGHVFVMGDNRTASGDSRCFGPIDEDLIVGRAFFKIWPPGNIGGL